MTENLEGAVAAWLPSLNLPSAPAAGEKDLRGVSVSVAKFTNEDTVRFFFPQRTLIFQQRMVRELAVILRKRGAKIISVQLAPEHYARWLEAGGKADTPELRYQFATRPPL